MDFRFDREKLWTWMKRWGMSILVGVVVLVLVGGAFSVGYERGRAFPKTIIVKGITNVGDKDATADFGLFWEVWDKLKTTHLHGGEAKDQDLVYSAIEGLTAGLDDPNTIFLKPEISQKFEEDIRGTFGGIGAEIGSKNGRIVVIAPLADSPAEHAGLRSGDAILEVDGKSTESLDVNETVTLIRGLIGTKVTLTIARENLSSIKKVEITRSEIRVPSVKLTFTEENIAHFELLNFNGHSFPAVWEAANVVAERKPRGIVLDLRNNPGGFLEAAVDIAGLFLEPGKVVATERFRGGEENVFKSRGNGMLKNIPLTILINGGSASASEILAGALHDHREVKLVGEKSFGKGTVQELVTLSDGSSKLKITIAEWLTPKGVVIDKNGIEPDVMIQPLEPKKEGETPEDVQLKKAIEVLEKEIVK